MKTPRQSAIGTVSLRSSPGGQPTQPLRGPRALRPWRGPIAVLSLLLIAGRSGAQPFTEIDPGLPKYPQPCVAWGDYDNDGDLDAMVMGYDPVAQAPMSRLYRNDAGTFVDSGQTLHNLYFGTLSWADYNNDGNLDLLLAGNGGGFDLLSIYRNHNAVTHTLPDAPTGLASAIFLECAGRGCGIGWRTVRGRRELHRGSADSAGLAHRAACAEWIPA
jgi:hypothetical protein